MSGRAHKKSEPWFAVGKPLGGGRSAFLMVCSFLLPLGVWCFFAYSAFLWPTDYRVAITATPEDKDKIPATYSPGDKIEEGFFAEFQEAIRAENSSLVAAREAGETPEGSPRSIRSTNKKVLRTFEPVLVANDWYEESVDGESGLKDYTALYTAVFTAWREIAEGSRTPEEGTLSSENLAVVKDADQS